MSEYKAIIMCNLAFELDLVVISHVMLQGLV